MTKINNIEKQKTKLMQLLASEVITQQEYRVVVNSNEEKSKRFLLHSKIEIEQ